LTEIGLFVHNISEPNAAPNQTTLRVGKMVGFLSTYDIRPGERYYIAFPIFCFSKIPWNGLFQVFINSFICV